jgi:hypothetical protein
MRPPTISSLPPRLAQRRLVACAQLRMSTVCGNRLPEPQGTPQILQGLDGLEKEGKGMEKTKGIYKKMVMRCMSSTAGGPSPHSHGPCRLRASIYAIGNWQLRRPIRGCAESAPSRLLRQCVSPEVPECLFLPRPAYLPRLHGCPLGTTPPCH